MTEPAASGGKGHVGAAGPGFSAGLCPGGPVCSARMAQLALVVPVVRFPLVAPVVRFPLVAPVVRFPLVVRPDPLAPVDPSAPVDPLFPGVRSFAP